MNYTTAAYERMVEEIKSRIGADEEPLILEEVAEHGADAGWGGFVYTTDCVEFYETHSDPIWAMLRDDAEAVANAADVMNVPITAAKRLNAQKDQLFVDIF